MFGQLRDDHARQIGMESGQQAGGDDGARHHVIRRSRSLECMGVRHATCNLLAEKIEFALLVVLIAARIEGHAVAVRSSGFVRVRCRSEEHTSELQSLMRNSYAVFCLKKKINIQNTKSKNISSIPDNLI